MNNILGVYFLFIWSRNSIHPERFETNLNFHPPEVVFRYRDLQLQVGENY